MSTSLRQQILAYIPMDRRHALASGTTLPNHAVGAAIFADISGFTALTDALVRELGSQRGAEELTHHLNQVYDAVIDQLHHFGGSAVAFAGDAVTCWMEGDNGVRAVACALAMQAAMQRFAAVQTPNGATIALTIKIAVTAGGVRRFRVGNPEIRYIDALAGQTLVRLAEDEHLAAKGEVVLDQATAAKLADQIHIRERRTDAASGFSIAVVDGLRQPVAPSPWPPLDANTLDLAELRPWLLEAVYTRLARNMGDFLAELRATVALFLRFEGIDYDGDEQAGQKLDAYIRWVQSVVARYAGTVIDLNIGDKGSYIYINFGAPLAHEDNIKRAASTALYLRQSASFLPYITSVQMGISQGRMRAGAYGGHAHRTYGVLGPEVNMAARLMMAAAPQQILVSQPARDAAGTAFTFQSLPPMAIKGRAAPATPFALLDERRTQGLRLPSTTDVEPMIGREPELAELMDRWMMAKHGAGQIALLAGEAGIGKSRLAAELVHRVEADGASIILGGECQSYGSNTPYLPWQAIWRSLLGLDPAWTPARQAQHAAARLAGISEDLPPRLPLLAQVLNLDLPDNELTAAFDAKLRKASLESLLVESLRSLARSPMLLILEDCHWLDPLSADLCQALAQVVDELPVMLFVTQRSLDGGSLDTVGMAALPNAHVIRLQPLTDQESAALVQMRMAERFGSEMRIPQALVTRLTAQAEGIPFVVDELVNYMHSAGVDPTDSRVVAALDLPDSIYRLVHSRIDQLDEHPKSVIKVASVLGRVFPVGWLARIMPNLGDEAEIWQSLEALTQAKLMERDPNDPETTCIFRQAIVQDATYESLPYAMRCQLHEHAGSYIEQQYDGRLERYLDLLVHHYDRSENKAKRRHYLRSAGEAAQAAYANQTAIDYYQRLLSLLSPDEQVAILLKLGDVLQLVGRWEDADACFRRALSHAQAAAAQDQIGWCHAALGELLRKQGRYDQAAQALSAARAHFAEYQDSAGLGQVLHYAGTLAAQQGLYGEAQQRYTESLGLRQSLGDQRNEAALLSNLGIVARFQGDYAQARALHERALAIRRELGDRWAIAVSLNNTGNVALDMQEFDVARQNLEEALTLLRQVGNPASIADALNNLGNVARTQQDFANAETLYRESLAINHRLDARWSLANLIEDMAGLAALRGAHDHAMTLAGAADQLRQALGAPRSQSEAEKLDQLLAPSHTAQSDAQVRNHRAAGAAMTLPELIAYIESAHPA